MSSSSLAEGVNQMASSIENAQRELKLARDNALAGVAGQVRIPRQHEP